MGAEDSGGRHDPHTMLEELCLLLRVQPVPLPHNVHGPRAANATAQAVSHVRRARIPKRSRRPRAWSLRPTDSPVRGGPRDGLTAIEGRAYAVASGGARGHGGVGCTADGAGAAGRHGDVPVHRPGGQHPPPGDPPGRRPQRAGRAQGAPVLPAEGPLPGYGRPGGGRRAAETASPTVSKTTPPCPATASRRRWWCRATASRAAARPRRTRSREGGAAARASPPAADHAGTVLLGAQRRGSRSGLTSVERSDTTCCTETSPVHRRAKCFEIAPETSAQRATVGMGRSESA